MTSYLEQLPSYDRNSVFILVSPFTETTSQQDFIQAIIHFPKQLYIHLNDFEISFNKATAPVEKGGNV